MLTSPLPATLLIVKSSPPPVIQVPDEEDEDGFDAMITKTIIHQ
jgi:hypothetical protein